EAEVGTVLSAQADALVRCFLYDQTRPKEQRTLLVVACQLLQRRGNETLAEALLAALHARSWDAWRHAAEILGVLGVGNEEVVKALLAALHDRDWDVRRQAAESLGKLGVGNEEVVRALLAALNDRNGYVRREAAGILGRLEIKDTIQLPQVLAALNRCLYDHNSVRQTALVSIRQLIDGRPIPC